MSNKNKFKDNKLIISSIILFSQYLVSKNPEKLGYVLQYYDEIFLLLSGAVQSHYLTKSGEKSFQLFFCIHVRVVVLCDANYDQIHDPTCKEMEFDLEDFSIIHHQRVYIDT